MTPLRNFMAMIPKTHYKKHFVHPALLFGTGVLVDGWLFHLGQLHELHGQALAGEDHIILGHHGGGGCSAGGWWPGWSAWFSPIWTHCLPVASPAACSAIGGHDSVLEAASWLTSLSYSTPLLVEGGSFLLFGTLVELRLGQKWLRNFSLRRARASWQALYAVAKLESSCNISTAVSSKSAMRGIIITLPRQRLYEWVLWPFFLG